MSGPIRARLADGRTLVAWSRESVAERLEDAARTLKALPATGCFPSSRTTRWPEVVRGFWEIWNALEGAAARRRYAESRNRRVAAPSAEAIDAMDETLSWLGWIEDRRKVRVLWGRAAGIRGTLLARELGVHRQTVTAWHREALETIARRLNEPARRVA